MEDRGVVFKAEGPNGWSIVGAGALVGVGLCIIALALWNLSMYAGVALIIVASGQAIGAVCVGASWIIEARGRARALIGPNTDRDIRELWGKDHGR